MSDEKLWVHPDDWSKLDKATRITVNLYECIRRTQDAKAEKMSAMFKCSFPYKMTIDFDAMEKERKSRIVKTLYGYKGKNVVVTVEFPDEHPEKRP